VPDELRADTGFLHAERGGGDVAGRESEAGLRLQQRQRTDQIAQADATWPPTQAQARRRPRLEAEHLITEAQPGPLPQGHRLRPGPDTARTPPTPPSQADAMQQQVDAQEGGRWPRAHANAEQVAWRQSEVRRTSN